MRLQEIFGLVRDYFYVALIAVLVLAAVFGLLYYAGRKTVLKGKEPIPKKRLIAIAAFIGYMIMVAGVTFLNRGPGYQGGVDLSLFSTYREAWYLFSVRHWQFIYLNILMLVPFGVLLPLLHPRFRKAAWTIGLAALLTLSIETIQLMTGYGNFVADDLFNNLMGAIIGYGLTMGVISLKEKGFRRSLPYFTPLLLVAVLSGSLFGYYEAKEFGNLSIVPAHRADLKEARVMADLSFSDRSKTIPVYRAPVYTKKQADGFARRFFGRLGGNPADIEDLSYPDEALYRLHGETAYQLSVRFRDGSYELTDFSQLDDGKEPEDTDEETLRESLARFGLDIPRDAAFQRAGPGKYEWTVKQLESGNRLTDGTLTAVYYNDGTVKQVDNRLVTYEKVKEVRVKSEQEAYEDLLKGKFLTFSDERTIGALEVRDVRMSYSLDSKGYYQPVYAFRCEMDGEDKTLLVPAI
ncbi:VanZ family protein [Edaphobacillus lindanitolerans]|uniref:Glycopeptide antibiotics resistance protein n=1 Tax=Edaphobacillus lindanitolerans TaxID=550447 RepID=A0A1U7PRP6_9BACI|nr:VanZ family protein [Edaphobacillus lindanitolerans]SIT88686.1 Glycopeptide antibiotics resistance protein [Edaphobacillus lindanitolerans]